MPDKILTSEMIKKAAKLLRKYKVKEPYLVKMKILKDEDIPDILEVHPTLQDFYNIKRE